jgi:hypothetical protein
MKVFQGQNQKTLVWDTDPNITIIHRLKSNTFDVYNGTELIKAGFDNFADAYDLRVELSKNI